MKSKNNSLSLFAFCLFFPSLLLAQKYEISFYINASHHIHSLDKKSYLDESIKYLFHPGFSYGLEVRKSLKNKKSHLYFAISDIDFSLHIKQRKDTDINCLICKRSKSKTSFPRYKGISIGYGYSLFKKENKSLDILTGILINFLENNPEEYNRGDCDYSDCFRHSYRIEYATKGIHPSLFLKLSWPLHQNKKNCLIYRFNLSFTQGLKKIYTNYSSITDTNIITPYHIILHSRGSHCEVGLSVSWLKKDSKK